MSEHLAATLDLSLAWERVKSDIRNGREFVRHPYEVDLVEADLDGWLEGLRNEVQNGFNPSAAIIADIPKGRGAVRPGALLRLEDRVVYAACVGTALPAIYSALEWSQGQIDIAYQIAKEHGRPEWIKGAFAGWTSFRHKSLVKIREGSSHVVVTDITGFYENIDISTLVSDLRQLGIDQEVVTLLSTCLNRWSIGYGRGIPQGCSASDVLAKVYLNQADLLLKEYGFDHLRYVDDLRIFCKDELEAKFALLRLSQILRRRSLTLQSAKTEILPAAVAEQRFEGVIPILQEVKDDFIKMVVEHAGIAGAYITLGEADRLAAEDPDDDEPAEVLRDAFSRYFLSGEQEFDNTLFHFLINRMKIKKDDFGHEYCLAILADHPEETGCILKYLEAIGNLDKSLYGLAMFLESGHALYDYQNYQIFEWLASLDEPPSERLMSIARGIAFDNAKPSYLRAACRRLIGQCPSISDLERIESSYATTLVPLERAQILCDLKELEAGRRNSFLARARRDHLLCDRAAQLVRSDLL
jgi:hypothetical protein